MWLWHAFNYTWNKIVHFSQLFKWHSLWFSCSLTLISYEWMNLTNSLCWTVSSRKCTRIINPWLDIQGFKSTLVLKLSVSQANASQCGKWGYSAPHPVHNRRLHDGVGVFVWGMLLNSRNLNYSALGTAIDFLLDRLTESRALGQWHATDFAAKAHQGWMDGNLFVGG